MKALVAIAAAMIALTLGIGSIGLPALPRMGVDVPISDSSPLASANPQAVQTPGDALRVAGVDPNQLQIAAPSDAAPLFQALAKDPLAAQAFVDGLARGFDTRSIEGLFRHAANLRDLQTVVPSIPTDPDLASEAARNRALRHAPLDAEGQEALAAEVAQVPAAMRAPLAQLVWAINEATLLRNEALAAVSPDDLDWVYTNAGRLAAGLAAPSQTSSDSERGIRAASTGLAVGEQGRLNRILLQVDAGSLVSAAALLGRAIDTTSPILADAALKLPTTAQPLSWGSGAEAAMPAIHMVQELGMLLKEVSERARDDPASLKLPIEMSLDDMNAMWDVISADGVITPQEHEDFEMMMHARLEAQAMRNPSYAATLELHHLLEHAMEQLKTITPPAGDPVVLSHAPPCFIDDSTPTLGTVLWLCDVVPNFYVAPPLTGADPALLVDLGGDDVYVSARCAVPPPTSAPLVNTVEVCLDLGGTDFRSAFDFGAGTTVAQGASIGGVAVVADLPLTDVLSPGCAPLCPGDFNLALRFGAFPLDAVTVLAQGAGIMGAGGFVDVGGNDFYFASASSSGGFAGTLAQGAGTFAGVGVFADVLGADLHSATASSFFTLTGPDSGESGDTLVIAQGAAAGLGVGVYVDLGDAGGFFTGDSQLANAFSDGTVFLDFTGVPGNQFGFSGTIGVATTIAQGAAVSTSVGVAVSGDTGAQQEECDPTICGGPTGPGQGEGFGQVCQATGGAAFVYCQGAGSALSVGILAGLSPPGFTCGLFPDPLLPLPLCGNNFHSVQALSTIFAVVMKIDGSGFLEVDVDVLVGPAQAYCQGAGHVIGAGALADALGNDQWFCRATSQAFAMAEAFLLFPPFIQANSVAHATSGDAFTLAQGAGQGIGIGILVDAEGNDVYFSDANSFSSVTSCSGPFGGDGFSEAIAKTGKADEYSQGATVAGGTTGLAIEPNLGLHLDLLGYDAVIAIADTSSFSFGWMASDFNLFVINSISISGDAAAHDKGYGGSNGAAVYLNLALGDPFGLLGAADFYFTSATSFALATSAPVVPTLSIPGATSSDDYGISVAGFPTVAAFVDLRPDLAPVAFLGCTADDFYFDTPAPPPPPGWGVNGGLLLCGPPSTWFQGAVGVGMDA